MSDIYYKMLRDDDDEGYFVEAYTPSEKNVDNEDLCVAHLHVPDDAIKDFVCTFTIGDIDVSPAYRRQGIATKMIGLMAVHLNCRPTGAFSYFSKDGQQLWESIKKKYPKEADVSTLSPVQGGSNALRV